ncbi:hypothetical protein NM208_g14627 [Fusarium decemcellulare]|uniref:Uncharacterized protein n=1 Tax=Fusarium decemcellulare TaxID=57161 RepID=A0ACC1RFD7_9HYPO|nr:hypothetical protein NM208_g14627 [Fusarium decemcellulare]
MWYLFNPTTQVQGWKETGWLGEKVAGAIQKKGIEEKSPKAGKGVNGDGDGQDDEGPLTVMGNKWQEAGAFAIDGTGTVIWGGKAMRADDVMELEDGARIFEDIDNDNALSSTASYATARSERQTHRHPSL